MALPDYRLIRSARRKSTSITIKPDNEIEVRAPLYMPEMLIHRFVASKHAWIEKKLRFNNEHRPIHQPKQFIDGETFLLFGEPYLLQIETGKRSVQFCDGRLLISHPSPEPFAISRQLTRHYRKRAQEHFSRRCAEFEQIIGVSPRLVGEKAYRSRWGSCHSDGRIYFNWRLIMAPEWVIDYVVVHELCHLVHPNHSKAYWQLVASVQPDYRKAKTWLKLNGLSLQL